MAKLNLTIDRLRAIDAHDMLGKTLELPKQIQTGMELGRTFIQKHDLPKVEHVDWYGLGGSAIAGDILQALGYEPPVASLRLSVQRFPRLADLPRIVCSYSGDTIEAVRAFEDVKPQRIWFAISSGGKIEKLAKQANVPHLKIPANYPPRAALGFMLGAMIAVCEDLLHCVVRGLPTEKLEQDAKSYLQLDPEENPALALAMQMVDRTPVIYTVDSVTMPAIAMRFRTQLAENAKVWSHSALLPEMAHNEVESIPFLGQVLPPPLVLLLGSWNLAPSLVDPRPPLRTVLDSHSIRHVTVDPAQAWPGSQRQEAGLRMLLLFDTASVYLAILRAIDPYQIPVITQLKKATTVT